LCWRSVALQWNLLLRRSVVLWWKLLQWRLHERRVLPGGISALRERMLRCWSGVLWVDLLLDRGSLHGKREPLLCPWHLGVR
jgi:hypothetical protein